MKKELYDIYATAFTAFPDVVDTEGFCKMMGGICKKKAYQILRSGDIEVIPCSQKYLIAKLSIIEYIFKRRVMESEEM